jgi:hypothetical protein
METRDEVDDEDPGDDEPEMSPAAERAAEVAAMPHVRRWIKRFKRLSRDMPPEVEVLVMAGVPAVLALDEHGRSYEKDSGDRYAANQDAVVDSVDDGRWDGGDW